MPCWWMPASCAKALSPTMALLRCTTKPVARETVRLAACSWVVRTLVCRCSEAARVCMAMTTSSREQLPARSPTPLTVHSICRAPACAAERLLATARPRSSWQCTESTARSMPRTVRLSMAMVSPYSAGSA